MKRVVSLLLLMTMMLIPGNLNAEELMEPKILLPSTPSAIALRLSLRELWQYQVTWTRSYIVSVISNLDDVNVVEDKLIKNQEKIGNAIKPYYGGPAGDWLAGMLRQHIVIAVEIVRAAKAGDAVALKIAQQKGRENADAMAKLLGRAKNPLWKRQFIKDQLYTHLEYVNMQVDYRLERKWNLEIKAYDDGLKHVLLIADLLAEGIIEQFPNKFKD